MTKVYLAFFIYFFSISSFSQTGWIISERTGGEDFNEIVENTVFIQENKIKSTDRDHSLIIDLNNWELILLDHANAGYWTGTPSMYTEYVKKFTLDHLKEEIAKANDYDKPYLEALYEDLAMDMSMGNDVISFFGELPVEVFMTDEQERIMGYHVNHYIIYHDRRKVEEVWLTRDINPVDVYNYSKFQKFNDEMSWGHIFIDYRSSEKYIHLMNQGLPLKTVEISESGEIITIEVVNFKRTSVDENIFKIPPHYNPMEFPKSWLF